MSKARFFGGAVDEVCQHLQRSPAYRVYLWNPNRTSIQDIALGRATSPRYDITDWVTDVDFQESITFENPEDSLATNAKLEVTYDANARPIPITERTLIDNAPIQIIQGDTRVPEEEWVPIFLGVIRGNPGMVELGRDQTAVATMSVTAVGREESYLNLRITARSYAQGTDVGRVAVEAAVEFMHLERREVDIGDQGYVIGHTQAQLVDIEAMRGIYEVLFTVGKKPKFNWEGHLVAADTDLGKPPSRVYPNLDMIHELRRVQGGGSLYNTVRLLGLDSALTEVIERERRLAHGSITAGFFCSNVDHMVFFSEDEGTKTGGRKAIETRMSAKLEALGNIFGESASWTPLLEEDGRTCFGGRVRFDTGFDVAVMTTELVLWLYVQIGAAAALTAGDAWAAGVAMEVGNFILLGIMLTLMTIGKLDFDIYGKPCTRVYQQLCATAQRHGLRSVEIREKEVRNDWLYDLAYMEPMVKQLLRRELIKGWAYEIEMLDDPLLEVDDVIEIPGYKFYVTSIRKKLSRSGGDASMSLTAWRIA